MALVLYHNPRCSKSRATLALLRERGLDPVVVDYLREPPGVEQILQLIEQLDLPASALVRPGEADYAASGLTADEKNPRVIASAIAAYPKLLQRPVVVANGNARIGRPPENVIDIL